MKSAILVPVGNAKVRDPKTKNYLLPDGETKTLSGRFGRYWRRRIRNGSVIIKPKKIVKKIVKNIEARTEINKEKN